MTLLDAINDDQFDAVFGGARRDEEKARAKERVFSFRDEFGQWDPKNQRPELWSLYNGRHHKGEHIRVFPLSNWTELDVWQYIAAGEHRAAVDLLRASSARSSERDGMWLRGQPVRHAARGRRGRRRSTVRFRTVGDVPAPARSSRRPTPYDEVDRRGRRDPDHRARRDPRRRPGQRGGDGRPQAGGLLLRWSSCASPPPAPSTTASRR